MVALNGDGGGSPVRTVLIKAGCLGRRGSRAADGGRSDGGNNGGFY